MSYAGDITPEEAWKLLSDDPEKIRRLLIQHQDDPNWFAEVLVLHRLTPPVRR